MFYQGSTGYQVYFCIKKITSKGLAIKFIKPIKNYLKNIDDKMMGYLRQHVTKEIQVLLKQEHIFIKKKTDGV